MWKGNKYRPFCSDRCQLSDLGYWATEAYCIPTDEGGEVETDSTQ